jgi:hypothetical protein
LKKLLLVSVSFLILSSVTPFFVSGKSIDVSRASEGNILYVGGTGPGNYTKIQDAIDNASTNDTVFVYHGMYTDFYPNGQWGYTVRINKAISLIGEDKNTTIINGTGLSNTVLITANHVNLSGFTIQNAAGSFCAGVKIMDVRMYINITNNVLRNNSNGVYTMSNYKIQVTDNVLEGNNNGVYSFESASIYIRSNRIRNNARGLFIVGHSWFVTVIDWNEFRNNSCGILGSDTDFIAMQNDFIDNVKHVSITKGFSLGSLLQDGRWSDSWYNNYWDNWPIRLPHRIKGERTFYILGVPVLQFPYHEIDLQPATTPYNYWPN